MHYVSGPVLGSVHAWCHQILTIPKCSRSLCLPLNPREWVTHLDHRGREWHSCASPHTLLTSLIQISGCSSSRKTNLCVCVCEICAVSIFLTWSTTGTAESWQSHVHQHKGVRCLWKAACFIGILSVLKWSIGTKHRLTELQDSCKYTLFLDILDFYCAFYVFLFP